ncbi:MAG: hypothetical protein AAF725_07275, partial [Acidobacteriota bacterium]
MSKLVQLGGGTRASSAQAPANAGPGSSNPGASKLVQLGAHRGEKQAAAKHQRRPEWLRIRLTTPPRYHEVRKMVDRLNLNTVCQEARCPNIYECWGQHGTATLMILGDVCTRRCKFCAVTSG